ELRDTGACFICGKQGHMANNCPNKDDKTCYNCGKNGHLAKNYREKMEKPDGEKKEQLRQPRLFELITNLGNSGICFSNCNAF
ncbi:hypothetical protein J4G37_63350, partial [Microvirga sp. 3-52]|nr:hypothetical protein [Microvirga sp. 3-52]